MRIVNCLGASGITTAIVAPLPNGEERHEFSLTIHYKTGKVTLHFDSYLFTEEPARQFSDAYCILIDSLGRNPHVNIGDVSCCQQQLARHLCSTS